MNYTLVREQGGGGLLNQMQGGEKGKTATVYGPSHVHRSSARAQPSVSRHITFCTNTPTPLSRYCDAMENLCPVCNENPLKGKQQACSSACRTAKHRRNSVPDTGHTATPRTPPQQRNRKQTQSPRRAKAAPTSAADFAQDGSLPSSVAERLLVAIVELRTAVGRTGSERRIDMKTQITAQAPPGAVGYRLVLPYRKPGVPPSFAPRRRNGAPRAFYALAPFEYPDDLRLCDGRWYRIVWIDSQGQQVRTLAGCPVPGLRYVVGPVEAVATTAATSSVPQLETDTDAATGTAPNAVPDTAPDTAQETATETSPDTASLEIPSCVTDASSVTKDAAVTDERAETSASGVSQETASSAETPAPSAEAESPLAPHQAEPVASTKQESQKEWASILAQSFDEELSRTEDMLATFFEEGSLPRRGEEPCLDGSTPFAIFVNTDKRPAEPAPASWSALLDDFPPITGDEQFMTALFSTQYWLLAQLIQELRRGATESQSEPSVPMRSYPISGEDREKVRNLVRENPLSSAFVPRCLAIVRYVREHGASVLVHFPQPLLPVSAEQRNAVENALRSPVKRAYMQYLSARLDAFLDQRPEPEEPKVSLKLKEQRQLIRTLSDIRAVMYFRQRDQSSTPKTDASA